MPFFLLETNRDFCMKIFSIFNPRVNTLEKLFLLSFYITLYFSFFFSMLPEETFI